MTEETMSCYDCECYFCDDCPKYQDLQNRKTMVAIKEKIQMIEIALKEGDPLRMGNRKMNVFEMVQAKCLLEHELKEREE